MTETLTFATGPAESEAADRIVEHHAEMVGHLETLMRGLLRSAAGLDGPDGAVARDRLVAWARAELVPHALAEEEVLYPLAHERTEGRLLVDGMLAEHRTILGLVDEVERSTTLVEAAAAARALHAVLAGHVERENDLVVPLLAAAPEVSLSGALARMHDALTHAEPATAPVAEGHRCGCHETDAAGPPELDARAVPHAIRHATVMGALDGLGSGSALVLVAPHDPKPLLAQIESRFDGAFDVSYLQRGPEDWRLLLTRR